MNNRKRLRQSLTVLSLTILMLAAVTVAWFVNWAAPFVDRLNFSSAALNVNVTITDEWGKTLPSEDGSAMLIAERMKPGDTLIYNVTVENKGADCKVYLGLTEMKNFVRTEDGREWEAYAAKPEGPHEANERFSDMLRVSVWQPAEPGEGIGTEPPAFVEVKDAFRFLADAKDFFFPQNFGLAGNQTLNLQYRIQFIGTDQENPTQNPTGAAPGNSYTEKKLEGKFAVSATLAK